MNLMNECVRAKVPATQKAVLLALAYGANEGGTSSPTLREIADRAGTSQRTVQRALRALTASGLLRCQAGLGTSNTYTIFPKGGKK